MYDFFCLPSPNISNSLGFFFNLLIKSQVAPCLPLAPIIFAGLTIRPSIPWLLQYEETYASQANLEAPYAEIGSKGP